MTVSDLVSVYDFCRNFPKTPSKIIARENLHDHLNKIFKDVSNFVLVEGGALSGKSEFAAGYMRRNTDSSVGVFLLPGDAYFYSPEYARLVLAEQIHWIVKGHAANFDVVDEHVYTKLLHQLQKKAKKGPITFVIDGLAQKGQPEYRLNSEILQLLPKSQPDFRFLITGSSSLEEDVRKINGSLKVVSLIEVAIEEATEFFSDIPKLSAKDISDIRRFCGGSVGQMSKFKGLIENHQLSVESMLAGQGGGLDDLMALEWKALESDEKLEKILAFLCFANRQISLNKISEMIGVDLEGMSIAISKCAFVEVEGELKNCSIRSTAQKNFLRKKLHKYESEIQDLYLADLLRNPESNDSVLYLPNQLMLLGKHEDLVSRLDVNHFCRLLKSQRSLRALKSNSDLGLAASRALNDEAGLARFALSGSVIGGLTFSGGSQSRIEALIRLGAVESAVELAFSSPTNEERLQLLAATGKALFDEKLHINHEVKQEIKRLIELVSAEALGPLAIDIACDLIVVDLEVAFDLFNKANSLRNEAEKNNSDLIQEDRQKKGDDNEIEESSVHHLKLRMSQRHHQRFSEALGQLVDRTSFEQISRRVTQDNDGSSDLVFLKEWIERRKRDPDAWKVANMALDLMLKDLARAPRADDLRAIAVVLPYITDQNEAEKLTKRIEALVETDLFLGTTVESVRLQMLLQRAKYVSFPAEAELAILDLFLNIEKLEDISTQVSCLSWMLYALQRFDGVDELERKTSLLSQTTSVLLRGIDQLLDSSADHFNAVKGAIFALAKANVQMAMDLAGRLNTEERRDSAFALLAHEFFKNRVFTDNPGAVITCIERISDENTKSIAIIFGLYKIADFSSKESMACCNSGIVSLWKKLRVANYRFQACSYALQIQLQTAAPRESIEELKEHLNLLWPSILVDWVKSNLAYCLVRDIAKVDREFSEMWLQKVVEEEKIACAPTEQYAEVLRLVASLAVRGYSYVADDTSDLTENNFKKVDQLIASLAIPQDKIILWCDLGIRLFYSGKKELARMICVDRVESILSEQYLYNEYVKDLMIADAAPFLFTMHQALANFHTNKIRSQVRKDIAISDVCYSLLRKKSSSDVYKTTDNDEHDIDSNVATSVISLVENVKTDWVIFDLVKVAANSLTSKRNESRIRRPQVIDFLNSLEIIVRKKLPEENNIKHDGFKISSLSQIYKARSAVSGGLVNVGAWESLYRDARSISNVADRSIATAFVAVAAKNKILSIDQNWIAEVKADAQLIPTMIDRIDRYVWLAQIMESAEKSQALILAKNGMELSVQLDKDVDAYSRQKRILDLVYNIDPDAVDKYIDLADRDPARKDNKKSLQDRAKLIKSQKDAAEAPAEMDFSIHSNEDLAELCMRNLASLNANRIIPRPIEDFRELGIKAAGLTISQAYGAWSWIIENAVKKAVTGSKADKAVHSIFLAAVNSGILLLSMLRGFDKMRHEMTFSSDGLVMPGDRDTVIDVIKRWAGENDGNDILISDPYFGPDDIDIIFSIASVAPRSPIKVLTGRRYLKKQVPSGNFEASFEDAWRNICDISPFDIEVAVVGVNSDGDHPIHDRWMVSEKNGLRLGTSANSIGHLKISEISPIDELVAFSRFSIISDFVSRKNKNWNGSKISIATFSIE